MIEQNRPILSLESQPRNDINTLTQHRRDIPGTASAPRQRGEMDSVDGMIASGIMIPPIYVAERFGAEEGERYRAWQTGELPFESQRIPGIYTWGEVVAVFNTTPTQAE